jgi:hypothetical protein
MFTRAVEAMGIDGSDLEEFHSLYAQVKKLPGGLISKDNLVDAIYMQFKPQTHDNDSDGSVKQISGDSDGSCDSVQMISPTKDCETISGFFKANFQKLTDSGDYELDMSGLRRKMGDNLESLINNDSFETDTWQKIQAIGKGHSRLSLKQANQIQSRPFAAVDSFDFSGDEIEVSQA